MNRIKLFLLSILFLTLGENEWAYAGNNHEAPIRFNVTVNSSSRSFIAFAHLKDHRLDVQENEMIMLNNGQGSIKKLASGYSYTARFKGANAFKQSIPYQMHSLYRISAERLATMNVGALKDYLSDKNQKVETLFYKVKIMDQDERSLLKRYEGMLQMPGKSAPDFALRDFNGKTVRISDFKGKMLVIDCWGSWCSGCLKNLPLFEKVADRYKDSTDVVFITMALETEDGIVWKNYIKEHDMEKGIHLQIINDPTWVFLRNIYQMDIYPRYIAIDRQGNFLDCFLDFPMYPAFKEKVDQWYKEKR